VAAVASSLAVAHHEEGLPREAWLGVQPVAHGKVRRLVAWLLLPALVAGPAEVLDLRISGREDPVDLFPRVPTDVAHPDPVGPAGLDGEPERVAHTLGDDAVVRGIPADQRVVRPGVSGGRIDP